MGITQTHYLHRDGESGSWRLLVPGIDAALAIITRYYPLDRFPQKTLYALAELLPKAG